MTENRYEPQNDEQFQRPVIDRDELRERAGVRLRHVHGYFEGTQLRFSFFFPEKEKFGGRFHHFVAPAQGGENASLALEGERDMITFALTHGAYFVESNMGVSPFAPAPDPTIFYRASACAAHFSRKVAREMYGDGKIRGYIFGGSGGGYKTMSCFENTRVWDGAVPFVIGSPNAIPSMFTVHALANRLLRGKLDILADFSMPGADFDIRDKLTREEYGAYEELSRFGFNNKLWCFGNKIGDGALPVLMPAIYAMDAPYFTDFWTKEGYEGSDPDSSARRDRVHLESTVLEVTIPEGARGKRLDSDSQGADESWTRALENSVTGELRPKIRIDSEITGDIYYGGLAAVFPDGAFASVRIPIEEIRGDVLVLGNVFGIEDIYSLVSQVKPGDRILVDNSDYIAIQHYHKHQYPGDGYEGWKQYRNRNYPQRQLLTGPIVCEGGAGSLQSGKLSCKTIVHASLMDESALPWQPDWYRQLVKANFGDAIGDNFRLYYHENSLHGDTDTTGYDTHVVSYLGSLYRTLLDLAAWVEKGVEPLPGTVYAIEDGQVVVPASAKERKGVQPTVDLTANGNKRAEVSAGESVYLSAVIGIPKGAGGVTQVEWSLGGEPDYPVKGEAYMADGILKADLICRYEDSGTHFPVVRVKIQRDSDKSDVFTQVMNLSRVRVVVR